ncbi:transaldolase [Anaeromyxobacter oryzisoli]|uniref:transaldolase n=1 Tax=Anaeromyxobacter oryzisoli TaxID=2925408 RepID=UPI001F582145|nr:transaldolase [Anaeromyxobacter sp. SG63]
MIDPIRALAQHGQSLWYDGLKRDLIRTGGLARLIDDGVRGLTTNPAIYEKAIAETTDYDADIAALAGRGLDARAIYEALAIQDLRAAADLMRPVWEETDGRDGFVSLEVSPLHAADTRSTVEEALHLWSALARPNVFIKVPGTPAGMPAIEALCAQGVNVNVTLLFSRSAYRAAAAAWMAGLEARARRGGDLSRAASVASFFVSRVDTLVDRRLEERARGADPAARARLEGLRGKAGIANAKLAYQDFQGLSATGRWAGLAARGARPQRVLFASTSTKDPRYPPLMYVEGLVGPHTVDTVPPETLEALRRGASIHATLEEDVPGARAHLAALEADGISMAAVTDQLLAEGVEKFAQPFERLIGTLEARRARLGAPAAGAHRG